MTRKCAATRNLHASFHVYAFYLKQNHFALSQFIVNILKLFVSPEINTYMSSVR